ncbi:MAG TPA: hypothetical protein VLJ88_00335 [Propionibacteriaceae bacterium]|nr:hypothetical protein [Propionibacteriaceae bacterium]
MTAAAVGISGAPLNWRGVPWERVPGQVSVVHESLHFTHCG